MEQKKKRPRRLFLRIVLSGLVALGLGVFTLGYLGTTDGFIGLTSEEFYMKVFGWPLVMGLAFFGVTSAHAYNVERIAKRDAQEQAAREAKAAQEQEQKAKEEKARFTFAAQVVGVQWLNPLVWKDYPTEWNLLWTLGLAKPNKDDALALQKPQKYSTVQPVSAIVFNRTGDAPFEGYFETYSKELFLKFRSSHILSPTYFYTVNPENRDEWREVQGIHVQAALPTNLNPQASTDFIRDELIDQFSIDNPRFSTRHTPPDVRVTQGGPGAGFSSLTAALDYLEQNPDKTAWVMSFDAPSFPKYGLMNESSTLLILAHPSYKTEREPLAWIHRVTTKPLADFTTTVAQGAARNQAWNAAVTEAAERANLPTTDIRYVIHDTGHGKVMAEGDRNASLNVALMRYMPDLDTLKQSFDVPALLGDLGAGTALTNIALGIAYAHHKNTPVLIASTRDPAQAITLVIRPPANPKPFDPNQTWWRARGEGTAYLPWWGRRFDAPATRMQGWSQ